MLIWFLVLSLLASVVQSAYVPYRGIDINDRFRGRVHPNPEYSEFASVSSGVNSGHDVFYGKAHDNPAMSAFKANHGRSAAVNDGFYGAVDNGNHYGVEGGIRYRQMVSDPIPNLIYDPMAMRYVQPTMIKLAPKHEGYGIDHYVENNNYQVPQRYYEQEVQDNNVQYVYDGRPPISAPTYMSAAPYVKPMFVPVVGPSSYALHQVVQPSDKNQYKFVAEKDIQKDNSSRSKEGVITASVSDQTADDKYIFVNAVPKVSYQFVPSVAKKDGFDIETHREKKPVVASENISSGNVLDDDDDFEFVEPTAQTKPVNNRNVASAPIPSKPVTSPSVSSSQQNVAKTTVAPEDVTLAPSNNKYDYVAAAEQVVPSSSKTTVSDGYEYVAKNDLPSMSLASSARLRNLAAAQSIPKEAATGWSSASVVSDVARIEDPLCANESDGTKIANAACRRYYSECSKGKAVQKFCESPREVFSKKMNGCVPKANAPECKPLKDNDSVDGKSFCSNRPDGFYRNPYDCSRIVQCFGQTAFEHTPCEHNLVFDESKGLCDYRDHVEGCEEAKQLSADNTVTIASSVNKTPPSLSTASGCGGLKHGEHIRNEGDCSTYYRCVWDRLMLMNCAKGTVFNPQLDVCDYPDAVAGCSAKE